jgi:hypothetical protein
MEKFLLTKKAVGVDVVVPHQGVKTRGKIVDVIPTTKQVVVEYVPGTVGEWDDPTDYYNVKDVKPDYDPEAMKALMKRWRASTSTTAGPMGPMKHVKSFLTGQSRRHKKRKHSKKTRRGRKRI